MLTAVIIPRDANLHAALRAPVAQQAIAAGFGLFTDGERTQLRRDCPHGWLRLAVKLRDLDPTISDEPEAA